ncbi:TOMM precursor leader peptide-binding protein [Streptomyces sp. NPDC050504]|uniref:TOMM precursor leader peptide-binding protein n=1 Tax=Streptomyces sp. NPDC050504 TaxID=3365618 RepID=UPI0037AC865B
MVKPALRRAWRDLETVQFGSTRAHAVTVGPVDTATASFLGLLDGTRGIPLLREEARAMGLPDGHADAVVARLTAAGLVDDPTAGGPGADALRRRAGAVDRLRPDLAALSVVRPEPGDGARLLAARRALRVQVRGAGRVGATLAAVLSAAGVGRVEVLDGGVAEPWDVAPGGLPPAAVGRRRDAAAQRVVRLAAPARAPRSAEFAGGAADGGPPLSLIVVAPRDGFEAHAPDPGWAEEWVSAGIPHLYAGVVEGTGLVGPLVLPGGTGCAGCLALTRAGADPAWPRLVAQWKSGRRNPVPACDLGLAVAVAGMAAAHALSFLDGELPASTGTRWEASLPILDWRAEQVGPHPECSCGAGEHLEGVRPAATGAAQDTMAG